MKRNRPQSNLDSSSESDGPTVATTTTTTSPATSSVASSVQLRPIAPIYADMLWRQAQGPIAINRGPVNRPWRPPIMPSHLPSSSRSPGSVAMAFANLSVPNYARTSVITHTRALSAQSVAPSGPMSQPAGSSRSQTPRGRGLAVLPSFWQGSSRGNQPPDWHTFGTIAEPSSVRGTSRATSQQGTAQPSVTRNPNEPSGFNPAQYFGQHSSDRPIPQRVPTESLPNLNLARNMPFGLSGTDRVAQSLRQQQSTPTSSQSTTSQQGIRQLNFGQRPTNAPQSAARQSKAERLAIVTNFEQSYWEAEARLNPNVSTPPNRAVSIESLANITRAHAHAIIGTNLIPTREEDKQPFVMNVAEQFRLYYNAKMAAKKKEIDSVSLAMYHDFYNIIYPPQRDIEQQAVMRRIVERRLPDIVPIQPSPPREEHQNVDFHEQSNDDDSSSSETEQQQQDEQLEPLDLSVRRVVPENVNIAQQEDVGSSSDSGSDPGRPVIDESEPLSLPPAADFVHQDQQQDDEDTLTGSDPEKYVVEEDATDSDFDDEDD